MLCDRRGPNLWVMPSGRSSRIQYFFQRICSSLTWGVFRQLRWHSKNSKNLRSVEFIKNKLKNVFTSVAQKVFSTWDFPPTSHPLIVKREEKGKKFDIVLWWQPIYGRAADLRPRIDWAKLQTGFSPFAFPRGVLVHLSEIVRDQEVWKVWPLSVQKDDVGNADPEVLKWFWNRIEKSLALQFNCSDFDV